MNLKTVLKRIVGVIVSLSAIPVMFGTICATLDTSSLELSTFMDGFIIGLAFDAFIMVIILIMIFISWCFNL